MTHHGDTENTEKMQETPFINLMEIKPRQHQFGNDIFLGFKDSTGAIFCLQNEFTKIEEGAAIPAIPISSDFLQILVEDLWRRGYRPNPAQFELDAMAAHIKTLMESNRQLFDLLSRTLNFKEGEPEEQRTKGT